MEKCNGMGGLLHVFSDVLAESINQSNLLPIHSESINQWNLLPSISGFVPMRQFWM